MKRLPFILILLVTMLSAAPAIAQDADSSAALLFAYYPKEGKEDQFYTGYAKHLEWHRAAKDPLTWYGWTVVAGDRTGLFVDGTFGVPFSALDNRVDPGGDRQDMHKNFTPHAIIHTYRAYRIRPDLSTGTPLEDGTPSAMVQAIHYTLHPSWEAAFENVLNSLQRVLVAHGDAPTWTCYQLSVGGPHPHYLILITRNAWADFARNASLSEIIETYFALDEGDQFLDLLSESVESVDSELWLYREDMSYLPEK